MPTILDGADDFNTNLPFVTEVGTGTNGRYRKWSDGFIEQWIQTPSIPDSANTAVDLPTAFLTSGDWAVCTRIASASNNSQMLIASIELTTVTVRNATGQPSSAYVYVNGF